MNTELKNENNKSLVLKLAEFFFIVYMITVYMFMKDKEALKYTYISFILFAGSTALHIMERKRMYFGKAFMLAYLSCSWMFASVLWAESRYYATIKVKTMWQLFVLFFLVYNLFYENKDAYKKYIKAMYIGGIAFVIYTVYSYGINDLLQMMFSNKIQRLGAEISQKNVYGMNHATTALIAFYYMMYNKKHKLFHLAVLCSSFICTMSSGSKKALLIVIIGVLYLIYKSYGIRQFYKVIGVTLFAGVLFYAAIQLPMFETMNVRFERSINALLGKSGGDYSTISRMSFIETGWQLFKDKMLIGYGADNFAYVSRAGTYAHNNFIEILVNFGLIGFVIFYSMYVVAFTNIRKDHSKEGRLLFVIFIVKTILELAGVNYFDKKTWIMLAFLLLPVNRFHNKQKNEKTDDQELINKGVG